MSEELHFNLLVCPWIPVLWKDGRFSRIGIREALTRSGEIRQIAACNPMDRVALLRFLLSVLMWCRENAKSSLAALDQQCAGVPEDWLVRLKEHQAAFDLLGDGKRFYQHASLKGNNPRSIADLLVEFPGADSVNHMRHVVHDGSYGFCPACCTMGILRLSVWAPANRYYPASVNPGSAAYALIEGKNLLQTLRANLPEVNHHTVQAPWLSEAPPDSPDVVARLAWRPRNLWLNLGETGGHCANCGTLGALVKSLCIERGWPTPVTTGQQFGKDVLGEFQKLHDEYKSKTTDRRKLANKVAAAASVILKCRMPALLNADSNAAQAHIPENDAARLARIFEQLYAAGDQKIINDLSKKLMKEEQPLLDQQDTQVKKFWVDDPHLLKEAEAIRLPDLGNDVGLHASKFWRDAFRLRGTSTLAVGIVGDGQYLYHDAPAARLPDVAATALTKLTSDCAEIVRGTGTKKRPNENTEAKLQRCGVLRTVTSNPDRQHPEIDSALKLLTPDVESRIRDRLSRLGTPPVEDAVEHAAFLQDVFAPVVERVIASVTPGSPLRRYAARSDAQALLNTKIKALVQKPDHPPNADSPPSEPAGLKRGAGKGDAK